MRYEFRLIYWLLASLSSCSDLEFFSGRQVSNQSQRLAWWHDRLFSKDDINFSVSPILIVPNEGLLLLGAVLIAGGFDGVFERSVGGERGVLLLVWNHF